MPRAGRICIGPRDRRPGALYSCPMCKDCFSDDDIAAAHGATVMLTPGVVEAMRMIEADLPGERVPETAWPVFLGEESGAIAWQYLQRLARAREAAGILTRMGTIA